MLSSPRLLLPRLRTRFVTLSLGLIALLSVCAFNAQAQQLSIPGLRAPEKSPSAKKGLPAAVRAARGEAPLSRLYDYAQVEQSKIRRLPALDPRVIREEESKKKLRIGVVRTFSRPVKVSSDSTLRRIAEGDVRVIGLVSEGALYTRVHFTGMSLPAGARVFVYSMENPEEFYGPYEGRGPSSDGTFWTPPMEGDEVAIEYFSPSGATASQDAPFQVSEISHIFKDPLMKEGAEDAAGACNLDVTNAWAEVARSVGHLQFTSGGNEYACTGTLLNNEANDQTPYLLTAGHCFNTQTEAQTLRVYWNYNSGNSPPADTPRTDGANFLASEKDTDFTLVRLTGTLPAGLYFSGWDASIPPIHSTHPVTGIHHPMGSYKRISFGNTIITCGNGLPGPCEFYKNVRWDSGITEFGSSGSGLWKGTPADARLVGTLTGGASSCSTPLGTDYYGGFHMTYGRISSYLQGNGDGTDDRLEDNDSRAAAREMSVGTTVNLIVRSVDEDWYKVTVAPGTMVTFTIDHNAPVGDIDLQLYRKDEPTPVSVGEGLPDTEMVQHRNGDSAPVVYYLRVYLYRDAKNKYSLSVQTEAVEPVLLILDKSGPDPNQAAVIDSTIFLRDPFTVRKSPNALYQSADRNRRLILFAANLQLEPGEVSYSIIVNLIDSNNQSYNVMAEDVQLIPGFNLTQVLFRLPDGLAPGTCTIKIKAHGQESNAGTIRIKS